MTGKKGHGSDTARKANAKVAKEGEKNPRKSSAAQAELGRKGGKAAAGTSQVPLPARRTAGGTGVAPGTARPSVAVAIRSG